ncbi:fimbrial protein [Obesumbacterium proteus]|uniref:F4 family fimbrial subunit n=1 Tax=Obesumbacterium proteus TaxID=82983 RepID=UPI0010341358|nr:fimbrial protein [Obesumbacterium proteus]TBL77967.1 fimbrial protein [Obesumbacterium proteus]
MNKKLGLRILVNAALLFWVGITKATVIDGGEVRFLGHVTDEGPRWTWHLASQEQNWAVDVSDAIASGKILTFSPGNGQTLPFLEGRLYRISERGGLGYTPQVQFSSGGQPFKLPEGGTTIDNRFRASVPVINPHNGDSVGQLKFTVEQAMAASFGHQDEVGRQPPTGMSLLSGRSVSMTGSTASSSMLGRLSDLLHMIPDFGTDMTSISNGQIISQDVLMSGKVMNIAAAYASTLSDFELILPRDSLPSRWQAKISVTVTVQ